jgi:hypothetical protein
VVTHTVRTYPEKYQHHTHCAAKQEAVQTRPSGGLRWSVSYAASAHHRTRSTTTAGRRARRDIVSIGATSLRRPAGCHGAERRRDGTASGAGAREATPRREGCGQVSWPADHERLATHDLAAAGAGRTRTARWPLRRAARARPPPRKQSPHPPHGPCDGSAVF